MIIDSTPRIRWSFRFALSLSIAITVQNSAALAQPPTGQQATIEQLTDRNATPIQMSDLPDPPQPLASLIRAGKVKFVTGGSALSNPDSLPRGGRLAGETRFQFRYRYSSRASWRAAGGGSTIGIAKPQVLIRVRFRSIKLLMSHEVWLRRTPAADSFWDDKIVRHEFDHVRISSDPRIERLFLDGVKSLESFRVPLQDVADANGRVSDSAVNALIEDRMKLQLRRVTDFVKVRYAELDRVTRHGLRALPDKYDLFAPKTSAGSGVPE